MLQNRPQHQKNMTRNTDAPDSDAPDDPGGDAAYAPNNDDDDVDYPKSIHLSLRNHNCNCNHNFKIAPNTNNNNKKNMTPNTDFPNILMTPMMMMIILLILTPCALGKTIKIT